MTIETSSIQADNGAGLTRGIIIDEQRTATQARRLGFTTCMGMGRCKRVRLFRNDPLVDAKKVGIEGVALWKAHWSHWRSNHALQLINWFIRKRWRYAQSPYLVKQ
jgi:hypothetical protein